MEYPIVEPQPWQASELVRQSQVLSAGLPSAMLLGHKVPVLTGGASVENKTM